MTATLAQPKAVTGLADRLSDHERVCMRRAFHHLTAGDAAGFHYALWVGFGDTWQTIKQSLIREGYVDARKREHDAGATPRSHEFLRSFEGQAA